MLWMGFWSPRSDPLYASLLVTTPHTQLLTAQPHATGFIPNIAPVVRASGGDGQRRIESGVAAEREQVLRLQVDARGRDPPDDGRRQVVRELQRAQPHVRAAFHPIAAELPAPVVAVVESRVLRVRVR